MAAALAGCVSSAGIAPSGQTLPFEQMPSDASFAAWPTSAWWQAYREPELDRLIESALAHSPDLERAQARLRGTAAAIGYLNARLLPEVTLGVDSTAQRYAEHSIYPASLAGDHEINSTIGFAAGYELDFFGRNRAAVEAATSRAAAEAAAEQAVRVVLSATVAQVYVELARLHSERAVVVATRAQREHIVDLVKVRVAKGIDSKVELRQAEGAVPQADTELALLDERIELLRNALAQLAVVDRSTTAMLTPTLTAFIPHPVPRDVPSDLIGRRADVVAARWRIESALAGVDSVKAEFYPSVNLNAFAGITSLGLSSLFETGARSYSLSPAVRLPIFDAGRLRAKLDFASAEVDAATAEYNDTLLGAVQDVVRALTSLRALTSRREAQTAAQSAADSAYALALTRYQAGLTGYLTVLATETAVLRERRAVTALDARALELDIALIRALGGGFAPDAIAAAR